MGVSECLLGGPGNIHEHPDTRLRPMGLVSDNEECRKEKGLVTAATGIARCTASPFEHGGLNLKCGGGTHGRERRLRRKQEGEGGTGDSERKFSLTRCGGCWPRGSERIDDPCR